MLAGRRIRQILPTGPAFPAGLAPTRKTVPVAQFRPHFSAQRPAASPAAVTPSSARKWHGRRQKIRELAVFPDWEAI
jgi:hypothetical protein